MARSFVVGIVLVAAMSYTASSSTANASVLPVRTFAQRAESSPPRGGPKPRHALLYVASEAESTVTIYDLSATGSPAVQQITDGVDSPVAISLDQNATLYIANGNTKTVTVYPFGQTSPTLTMSDGVSVPIGIAVTSDGTRSGLFRL